MAFAPEYVACVLAENFEDAKRLFLSPLLAIHYAHLVMLADCRILPAEQAHALRLALDQVSEAEVRAVKYDGSCEDLFFYLNRCLEQACGSDLAGRLHTARSRNDIDMTLYRMRQRSDLLGLLQELVSLRGVLHEAAAGNRETIVPLHTHTQPAQPSTLAHYLLAAGAALERDTGRLRAAFASINRCPLGACAITGTGFPIDRRLTSELLGFSAPTGNTYDSIASVDALLEAASQTAVMLTGLGRLLQDLLLWCTAEFGYLTLGDGFVQGSSIMPQKRNPVALEHARTLCSKAVGESMAVFACVHNTPFGDIVDTEDDLQPLVHALFHDATRVLRLVKAAISGARFNRGRLAERAGQDGITLTELADTLVREHGLAFATAHAIAREVAIARAASPGGTLSGIVADASRRLIGRPIVYSDERLEQILSPAHFVEVRTTHGGPAPEETARALEEARERLAEDRAWLHAVQAGLEAAAGVLRQRSEEL